MTRGQEPRPDSIASQDEGFLRRWSRRKREASDTQASTGADLAVAATADAAAVATPPAAVPVEDGPDERSAVASEPPGDEDMPALDTLGPESNVSAFFSPRVSETLRRAALYRIFHQPSFNVTDGLDDYSADYRHLKPLLGNVITSDMRLQMERAKERLLSIADKPGDPGSETHVARLPEAQASAEPAPRVSEVEAAAEDEELPDGND